MSFGDVCVEVADFPTANGLNEIGMVSAAACALELLYFLTFVVVYPSTHKVTVFALNYDTGTGSPKVIHR